MAATTTMLLLVLAVMVEPIYLQQVCSVSNTTTSNGNFTLTLTPNTYFRNTNYNVTINGTGNVTYVSFRASEEGSNLNTSSWNASNTCYNSSDIYMYGPVPLVAHWKSSNGTSAAIRAFITVNDNTTYIVMQVLKTASDSASTPAPTITSVSNATKASNATAVPTSTVQTSVSNATKASNATAVTVSTAKATNSVNSVSCSSWILILLLHSAYMAVKNRVTC